MLPTDTDTRLWKKNLPQTSFAGDNNVSCECDLLPVRPRGLCFVSVKQDMKRIILKEMKQLNTAFWNVQRHGRSDNRNLSLHEIKGNWIRAGRCMFVWRRGPIYPVPSPGLLSPSRGSPLPSSRSLQPRSPAPLHIQLYSSNVIMFGYACVMYRPLDFTTYSITVRLSNNGHSLPIYFSERARVVTNNMFRIQVWYK